jgi:hypothetical protein
VLGVSVAGFALAWWLGLYLVARDLRKPSLRRAGAGLLGYSVALAADAVTTAPVALLCVPALAWTGVLVLLLPAPLGPRLDAWWRHGVLPLLLLVVFAPVTAPLVLLPLAAALVLLLAHRARTAHRALLAAATLMFGLGAALVLLGLHVLPPALLLPAIGVDLLLFGVVVAATDALDEGEALRADLLRSLVVSAATTVLFGGQVVVALLLGDAPLEPLLFGVVAAAITVQVLANPLAAAADRVVLPGLAPERARLREAADALPRRDPGHPLAELDDAEFARLTRRALSHYGDLAKLVSSPLANLPVIDARLAARGAPDQPLERAAELKQLLSEGIARLKPRDGDFGTSDEWRHYNALYFYYVAGIRPYSRRTKREGLDAESKRALAWFVTQVPERTLHNWQNAAARLVAADLRGTSSQVEG